MYLVQRIACVCVYVCVCLCVFLFLSFFFFIDLFNITLFLQNSQILELKKTYLITAEPVYFLIPYTTQPDMKGFTEYKASLGELLFNDNLSIEPYYSCSVRWWHFYTVEERC